MSFNEKKPYTAPAITARFASNVDFINDKLVAIEQEMKKMKWDQRMQHEEQMRSPDEETRLDPELTKVSMSYAKEGDFILLDDPQAEDLSVDELMTPFDDPGEVVETCTNCGQPIDADTPPCGFSHTFELISKGIKPKAQF